MSNELIGLAGVVVGALIAALVALVVARRERAHLVAKEQRDRRADMYVELSTLVNRVQGAGGGTTAPSPDELMTTLAKVRILASREVQDLFLEFTKSKADPAAARELQERMHVELNQLADGVAG